jgi:hypothetical protein
MSKSNNEKIEINGRILQVGVLSNDKGYQLYLYPGMTVAELAFCHMVTIRLLLQDNYIKSKREFDNLVKKYFNDPQYAPIEVKDVDTSNV